MTELVAKEANDLFIANMVRTAFGDEARYVSEDFSGEGGLSAEMTRLRISNYIPAGSPSTTSATPMSVVYKNTDASKITTSIQYGLAREAFFYTAVRENKGLFKQAFGEYMPQTYYSEGNMETGFKRVLMDDLSDNTVQSGYFFGPSSPHSWGKDLGEKMSAYYTNKEESCRVPDAVENEAMLVKILSSVACLAGKLHGTFWGNETLLETEYECWLRNAQFYQGKNESKWKATFIHLQESWKKTAAKITSGETEVVWQSDMVDIISASLEKDNWESFQADLTTGSAFTLIHGDFHPANMMIYKQHLQNNTTTGANAEQEEAAAAAQLKIAVIDYEMIGIGKGGQDIGQYMISHLDPVARRSHEEAFLHEYYDTLTSIADNICTYTYEMCVDDYIRGGSEKWVFYLVLMADGLSMPTKLMQFFHDQVWDFMKTHHVTPSSIGPPRF